MLSRYGVLAMLDPHRALHPALYLLPSLALSAGGQFFVFFQVRHFKFTTTAKIQVMINKNGSCVIHILPAPYSSCSDLLWDLGLERTEIFAFSC